MNRRGVLGALAGGLAAACSPLSAFNTLTPKDAARIGPLGVAFGDHPRQRLDIYAPPRPTGAAPPVFVWFYGGAWNSGRRSDYRWVGQALAAQGFLAVLPDHRIVPEVRYPGFVEDAALAVAAAGRLAAEHGGDPERIVVGGHSSGAYNAAMLAFDRRWLAAAGAPPVRAFAGLSGPYDFHPFDVPASIEAFGGVAEPRLTQPVNLDLGAAPPAFIAHGDRDTVVGLHNARNLARALQAAGRDVALKIYEGLDHRDMALALSRPFRGKAPVLADMTAFLRARLG